MESKSVAELVEDLFKIYRHPSGREYSNQEVSDKVNGEIDASYIAKIRRGVIKNPGRNGLLALCQCFGIPPTYFFPELHAPVDPNQPKATDPMLLAHRSTKVGPKVLRKLEDLLQALKEEEEASDTAPEDT